ncbi:LLM class flavin-dependent oxidoreductase [Actinoplanes sp. NPDC049265]|uniref:LLM class flavin-dependent oxidoreductase n=1 Tax=Actinoplanes sp. NPDC049265 TaxID=3363902 RepID=UPI003723A809
MKLGLYIADFTFADGPGGLGPTLARIAREAEDAGFDRLAVMDHLWQHPTVHPERAEEFEMLEAYTTLAHLAAHTSRVKLLALVTAVSYRAPAMLAKLVTTLDVLSGGRAILGLGAGSYPEEARGLDLPFPPLGERFDQVEATLRVCRDMFAGRGDRLNHPAPLSRPRPPILVGGGGETRTLRLVAEYADACNFFGADDLPRKLRLLREHCDRAGRDFDEIEKSVMHGYFDPDDAGLPADLERYAALGFTVAYGGVPRVDEPRQLRAMAERVIPAAAKLG